MSGQASPFVSVIIPVRNEARYIGRCLRSLLDTNYPAQRWEIIIADGVSEDATRTEIARIARRSAVPIIVIDNPRRVTPMALNRAITQARGNIIIRVDAHAEYGSDYVARRVQVLRERGADNVGGPVTTRPGAETPMARAIALAMAHPFGVGNSVFRTAREAREVDTVPFGCFHLDIFQRIGLFDERLVRNQDYNLNQRIRQAGGSIWLDPRLESTYFSRPTLQSLLKQAFENGFWNAMTHFLHPASFCVRHAIPVLFALGIILLLVTLASGMLGVITGWMLVPAITIWAGYGAYALVTLAVATGLARRHGIQCWPSLLLVFPTFHLVYGLGIAWGWLQIALRRFPWQAGDGIPTWEASREEDDVRTAA